METPQWLYELIIVVYYSTNDCPKWCNRIYCKSSWVALDYNSIVKNWLNRITKITQAYAFHIDSTTLPDGTYELVPESESEQREAQVNLTEAVEDPNQSSEEPKANFA